MSLQIVHYNTPILREKGAKITQFDAALLALSEAMIATMHAAHGIGLAAQQVGHALQLCVVDLRNADIDFTWELDGAKPPLELFMPMVLVNPVVRINPRTDDYVFEEGCLSFPEIRGDVIRPDGITVKFMDQHGVPHILATDGLFARCIQHEVDHLNGVLFIDRMEKPVRSALDKDIKALALATKSAGISS
ncbi:MAG: peptide deformylase [Cephaloticoccus sp.]|nr:peptide deformylase [Cephaloticoccus sp.]MCF7759047.1 peptide deformylase [Cephaloticoccus sp.]